LNSFLPQFVYKSSGKQNQPRKRELIVKPKFLRRTENNEQAKLGSAGSRGRCREEGLGYRNRPLG
jgi:hypothetical protein